MVVDGAGTGQRGERGCGVIPSCGASFYELLISSIITQSRMAMPGLLRAVLFGYRVWRVE